MVLVQTSHRWPDRCDRANKARSWSRATKASSPPVDHDKPERAMATSEPSRAPQSSFADSVRVHHHARASHERSHHCPQSPSVALPRTTELSGFEPPPGLLSSSFSSHNANFSTSEKGTLQHPLTPSTSRSTTASDKGLVDWQQSVDADWQTSTMAAPVNEQPIPFTFDPLATPRPKLSDLPSIEDEEPGSEPEPQLEQRQPAQQSAVRPLPKVPPGLDAQDQTIELPASARLVIKVPYKDSHADFWDASPTSYGCLDCSVLLENMGPRFLDEWQVTDVSVRFLTVPCPVPRSYGYSQREQGPEQYEDFTSIIGESRSTPPSSIHLQLTLPPRAADGHVCAAAIRFPVSVFACAKDRTFMICGSVVCKAKEIRTKERDWIKAGGRWVRKFKEGDVKPGTTVNLQCESIIFTISSLRRGVDMSA